VFAAVLTVPPLTRKTLFTVKFPPSVSVNGVGFVVTKSLTAVADVGISAPVV
jgi:hypothetical protein